MKSEALRNVRTMRQVKTSLDLARRQKTNTTNSLSRTEEEKRYLENLADPRLARVLEREKKRSAALDAAVNKSRQRMLRSRHKLAMTVNKNRALTELRQKLQQARWEDTVPATQANKAVSEVKLHQIELSY
ncbi:MAG: hypothetical protein HYX84_02305 [Chloroflexi bacterium]|nr:hypothetical protein [Chloroflexota bacterium]